MEGGTGAGTIDFSARLGVRALIKAYGVRVLWCVLNYLRQESTQMLAMVSSIIQKSRPRSVFVSVGLGFSFFTYV